MPNQFPDVYECLQSFSWLHSDGKLRFHEVGSKFEAVNADVAKAKRMGFVAIAQVKTVESDKTKKSKKADEE